LEREGDETPGAYRLRSVQISKSEHLPPEAVSVPMYMAELVQFINRPDPAKYDLIKVALAHHRFAWIHPFGNGNGRVVRLMTYALLVKYGFKVKAGGRVLNPTAVFCNDRDRYYVMLGQADTGTTQGRETWCVYVLGGMLDELRKVDRLTDADFLIERILSPALRHAREREWVTATEERVLLATARHGVAKASDLSGALPGLTERQRTYQIGKLVERLDSRRHPRALRRRFHSGDPHPPEPGVTARVWRVIPRAPHPPRNVRGVRAPASPPRRPGQQSGMATVAGLRLCLYVPSLSRST
jgi:Fic family protein